MMSFKLAIIKKSRIFAPLSHSFGMSVCDFRISSTAWFYYLYAPTYFLYGAKGTRTCTVEFFAQFSIRDGVLRWLLGALLRGS
jgi:hypothetical protein